MNNGPRFDLEHAIATWRQFHARNRVFSREDLDELEQHLRDHYAALVAERREPAVAFHEAMVALGDIASGENEYEKVRWGKLRRRNGFKDEIDYRAAMVKSTLTIALRTLNKRLGFSAIKGLSLVVGLTSCLLIGIYVYEELRYDRHHEQVDRIYRVTNLDLATGKQWAPIGPPVGPALAQFSPSIETVVRVIPLLDNVVLSIENQRFQESDLLYADPSMFEVFSHTFLRGSSETALNEPNTIVLSERLAQKYFGQADPMGQLLLLNENLALRVTGVIEDPRLTTHMSFDGLVSMQTFYGKAGAWVDEAKTWSGFYTYVLLKEEASAHSLEAQFPAFITSFYDAEGTGPATEDRALVLQPLADIHLHSHLEKEMQPNGNLGYVRILSIVGLFLLVIGVVNFANMAIAQSVDRGREVGVRKTLGAAPQGLIGHFLAESMVLVFGAGLVAYSLAQGLLPLFRQAFGKALDASVLNEPIVVLGLLVGLVLLGLCAGGYPAFVLSRLRPVTVLKGRGLSHMQGLRLREGLLVFQFVIATGLLIGTAIVYEQLEFLTQQALGFDRDRLIDIQISPAVEQEVARQASALKDALLQQAGVEGATFVSGIPGERMPLSAFEWLSRDQVSDKARHSQMRVVFGADRDYIQTLGLKVLHEQDITNWTLSDTSGAFYVNQAVVRSLGVTPEELLGEPLLWTDREYRGTVVGIIEDYHYASLHHPIAPLVIPIRAQFTNNHLLVRVSGGRAQDALQAVGAVWEQILPGMVFSASFLDEQFNTHYHSEQRMSRLLTWFTVLALLVACLGLFGMVALMIAQRQKELGIRKVLGASTVQQVRLLSHAFSKLLGVAFLVAAPLVYLLMPHWLDSFAYQVDITPMLYIMMGLVVAGLALLTIGYHVVKASLANPLESLHYE